MPDGIVRSRAPLSFPASGGSHGAFCFHPAGVFRKANMEEIGTVIRVGNRTAQVSTQARGLCRSCSARGVCHISGRKSEMEVEAWNHLGAAVGDQVLIRVSGRSTLTAVFLLYFVPLLGFLLGVFLGQNLTGQQVWAVVVGLAVMAAIYAGIRLFDRRIGRSAGMRPEIVKILVKSVSRPEHEAGGETANGASSMGVSKSESG